MNEAMKKHLISWFKSLNENRKDRAILRRCKSLDDIICTPEYANIYKELREHETEYELDHDRIGYIIGLLSHVEPSEGPLPKLPEAMAATRHRDNPIISKLRFQILMKIKTRKKLYQPMIRIIRNLNPQVNPCNLIDSIYWWEECTTLRRDWTMAYYGITSKSKGK